MRFSSTPPQAARVTVTTAVRSLGNLDNCLFTVSPVLPRSDVAAYKGTVDPQTSDRFAYCP